MNYFLKRLLGMVPLLLIISALAFLLVRMAPGGPFDKERVVSEDIDRKLKEKYHLNDPLWKQYLRYLGDLVQGNLGPSLKYRNHTVNDVIRQGLPVSMVLGGLSFVVALGIGIPVGVFGAWHHGRWPEFGLNFMSLLAVSVPGFVVGPVLAVFLAVKWRLLPVALWESPWHTILPTLTLALFFAGKIARLMREGLLGIMHSDFLLTARAKGCSEQAIFWKHALPLAILPVVSYSGPLLADLFTGSFVVENFFQIPGIGVFMVNSSMNRDYPMVVGLVLVYAVLLLLLNLLVDFAYRKLDPRVRYE
jgi:oligopeptide transport system permease protein